MRLVFISDTHLQHGFDVPDGDLLVHCGDFTMRGRANEIAAFDRWLKSLPHRHKVAIAGNHDLMFEDSPKQALSLLKSPIYLQDSLTTIEGFKIYGSPWTPWFYDWAFNLAPGRALAMKWDRIPADVDVLVTHGPPHGILDQNPEGEHCGDDELLEAVQRIKPKIHAFGHIHSGHGALKTKSTLFVNASICTERYDPLQDPVIVDLFPKGAVRV